MEEENLSHTHNMTLGWILDAYLSLYLYALDAVETTGVKNQERKLATVHNTYFRHGNKLGK